MSKADMDRYMAHMHAVQTGVAYEIEVAPKDAGTSPKHLRTGINSAMVNDYALAQLLMDKGIFTRDEYDKALADAAQKEHERYEQLLSDHFGREIKLG